MLGSCGTLRLLERDVRAIHHDARIIGRIDGPKPERVKVLVCRKNPEDGAFSIADFGAPNQMGDFVFLLPDNQSYYLAAIEDLNQNTRPDPDEPVSFYGGDGMKEIPMGRGTDPQTLILSFTRNTRKLTPAIRSLRQALRDWSPDRSEESGLVPIACGEHASLDDPTFDSEAGRSGLWAPVTSAKRYGLGIYFLEPYDPAKIPVIFVHGIGGTPRSWKPLVQSLDHRRYQAWVYSYPSGVPIGSAALGLANLLDRLHRHYGFGKLHVVAHSMGGLVARRSVQIIGNEQRQLYVSSLTTISTPWNGVPFAGIGTVGLPVPVPCWIDLRPGSTFIGKILDDPLPVPHLLISTEKSRFHFTLPRRNDGSVSVASQLDPRAVSKAAATAMIDEDHSQVLEVEDTPRLLGKFLRSLP